MKRARSGTTWLLLLVGLITASMFTPIAMAEDNIGMPCNVDTPTIYEGDPQNSCTAWPKALTDEWECAEGGPVSAIYFWGYYNGNRIDAMEGFHLSIRRDIPVGDPSDPCSYSVPAPWTDWEQDILFEDVTVNDACEVDSDGASGTSCGQCEPMGNDSRFKYQIQLPEEDWFWQRGGITYWLDISACGMQEDQGWEWDTAHVVQCPDDHEGQGEGNNDIVAHLGNPQDWEALTAPVRGDDMDVTLVTPPTPELPTVLLLGLGILGLAGCIGIGRVRRGRGILRHFLVLNGFLHQ